MKSTGKFKAIIFIILLSVLLTACESTANVNTETASASDAEAAHLLGIISLENVQVKIEKDGAITSDYVKVTGNAFADYSQIYGDTRLEYAKTEEVNGTEYTHTVRHGLTVQTVGEAMEVNRVSAEESNVSVAAEGEFKNDAGVSVSYQVIDFCAWNAGIYYFIPVTDTITYTLAFFTTATDGKTSLSQDEQDITAEDLERYNQYLDHEYYEICVDE